jgi:hypothetical protein
LGGEAAVNHQGLFRRSKGFLEVTDSSLNTTEMIEGSGKPGHLVRLRVRFSAKLSDGTTDRLQVVFTGGLASKDGCVIGRPAVGDLPVSSIWCRCFTILGAHRVPSNPADQ